ncbi:MAG: TROVE domain-containing protein [Saprospiraceae bacterium]|nr:TROVE domain-containing protein [Saprospiraceae bacterium]
MALFNFKTRKSQPVQNLAGGQAYRQDPRMELASLLLTSFAQDQFYRTAKQTFAGLEQLLGQVDAEFAAKAAVFARTEFGMRSITQVVAAELAKGASGAPWAKSFYNQIVKRPDDMLEIMAYYFGKGNKMLPNAMKKGFAQAFDRFDGYSLAKYRGENRSVKLVDVVNLVRPVPTERNAEALKNLIRGELKAIATWENKLSRVGQVAESEVEKSELKAAAWAELLQTGKLGYLALLRNLRNIAEQAPEMLGEAARQLTDAKRIERSMVFPFQFLVAMDAIEKSALTDKRIVIDALNQATELALKNVPRFEGRTLVVLDDSGSMSSVQTQYANRSALQLGALFAAALYKANNADLMRFSDNASYVGKNPADSLQGIADFLIRKARSAGTNFNAIFETASKAYDRIVILSDMQGWMQGGAPTEAFAAYRRKYDAQPTVFSFDLQGYGSLQFPESRVFALAGFSDKVFDLMRLLETDRMAMVKAIEGVEWK